MTPTADGVGSAAQPIVPEPVEESSTRPRTRSDKPFDPEGSGAGVFQPAVPDADDENNPFNQTVDESDLPTALDAGFDAPNPAGDPEVSPPADDGGFMFDSDPPTNSVPPADPNTEPSIFDINSTIPAPPSQRYVQPSSAIRSIKSRGVQLQIGGLPVQVRDLEISLPGEDTVNSRIAETPLFEQVSFDDFESKSRAEEMPLAPAALSAGQVGESLALPTSVNQIEALQDETEVLLNPLRRGAQVVRRKQKVKKETSPMTISTSMSETTVAEQQPPPKADDFSVLDDSRTLSSVAASRSLRNTLRRNPLRR